FFFLYLLVSSHYYIISSIIIYFLFFFNDTATTEIYTLSLHDALPISLVLRVTKVSRFVSAVAAINVSRLGSGPKAAWISPKATRSEEHTSELQSRGHLVCRLLLEKKKKLKKNYKI